MGYDYAYNDVGEMIRTTVHDAQYAYTLLVPVDHPSGAGQRGREVMFFSPSLSVPSVSRPLIEIDRDVSPIPRKVAFREFSQVEA
ncbi:MAG: hypothetical protein Pars93KO_27710 [Parasphingorhabdus sp.]